MTKIEKVWFDENRIYLKTDQGEELSRPLEAFPILKDASTEERMDFRIGRFGDGRNWMRMCIFRVSMKPQNLILRMR